MQVTVFAVQDFGWNKNALIEVLVPDCLTQARFTRPPFVTKAIDRTDTV